MGNLPDGSNGLQVNHETGSEKEANGSRTNSGTDQNDRVEVTDGTSSENEVNTVAVRISWTPYICFTYML